MTRLTNTIRDAFIRAAMNDVPSVDYTEQIRAAVMKATLNTLPKPIRAAWEDAKTRPYIKTRSAHLAGRVGVQIPCDDWGDDKLLRLKLAEADRAELDRLAAAMKAQEESRRDLERKIKACAYSVTTRKALVSLLPEFEKYLPADEPAALRTLPVVANVVADFVKAGWSSVSTT